MNSDLFALKALADELDSLLKGARIDKIQQPEPDELRFYVRNGGKNMCLRISCNAGAPGIYITSSKKNSPVTAPPLCMLLRKYLGTAYIDGVKVFNNDRIIKIKINARTEMRDDAVFYLFAEIMNRYSNIVFTDENYVILDSVKRIPFDAGHGHTVLRGVTYQPMPQPKTSYLTASVGFLDAFNGGDLHQFILDTISGFSGVTASEVISRAGLTSDCAPLKESEKQKLFSVIEAFKSITENNLLAPCIIGGKDAYPLAYTVLNGKILSFNTMSEAYDKLLSASDGEIRNKARLKNLAAAAKRLRTRTEKNITIDKTKLLECEKMEELRLFGELIVTNIYKIKRGDTVLTCINYYDGNTIEVPLDEKLSPSKNSTAYYNKYNKLKRAKDFTEKKLVEDELLLNYVISIEDEITNLSADETASAIEEELSRLGVFKKPAAKGKVRKEKAEPPIERNINGFRILSGRNNLQNDELTFKTANSSDMWLHLKNRHGVHTVILSEGREIPDGIIKTAAEITASTDTVAVEVDYTERRNVKRQPGGHPGQVIYVNYKTMLVTPDKHENLLVN